MSARTTRGAAAAALVAATSIALTSTPALAASPDAARAKAPSHLRVASKVYDAESSGYAGLTMYDVTFLLKRRAHPYANKRICLYVKLPRGGYLRGECDRTDAAGHALLHLGGSGKSVYYITFKGDRKTKGTTKKVVIHGHKVPITN